MTQAEKINRIYDSLVGSDLQPNGLIERVKNLEVSNEENKKMKWLVMGGAGVISFLISLIK